MKANITKLLLNYSYCQQSCSDICKRKKFLVCNLKTGEREEIVVCSQTVCSLFIHCLVYTEAMHTLYKLCDHWAHIVHTLCIHCADIVHTLCILTDLERPPGDTVQKLGLSVQVPALGSRRRLWDHLHDIHHRRHRHQSRHRQPARVDEWEGAAGLYVLQPLHVWPLLHCKTPCYRDWCTHTLAHFASHKHRRLHFKKCLTYIHTHIHKVGSNVCQQWAWKVGKCGLVKKNEGFRTSGIVKRHQLKSDNNKNMWTKQTVISQWK